MIKTNITYNSVLQPIKNVKARTEAFHKLSDEDKRREIAWDALQQVISGKFYGSAGSYWDPTLLTVVFGCDSPEEFQQNLIEFCSSESWCKVCARGAVMASTIILGNHISPKDPYFHKGNPSNVQGFNIDSMINMEKEYETSRYDHPYTRNTTNKLANILCNVIVNGDFNTEDRTDYL